MRRLIIRPGAIGDFLVSLPALEFLKADYTEVWTTTANLPLVRFANQKRSLLDTGIDTVGLPGRRPGHQLFTHLCDFDSIVSWYGAARGEFREAVSGFPFQFHPALPRGTSPLHAVDFYLSQVGAPHGGRPHLPLQPVPQGYAIIHPFSGGRTKNWPLDHFQAVANALDSPVFWCAGPEERLDNARRFDDLWDLAQWIAGAALYIGNDSGISHLAAAVDVPVVALFGPTDPSLWAPRGRQVTVVSSPDGRIESIPAAAVIAAAQTYLRK